MSESYPTWAIQPGPGPSVLFAVALLMVLGAPLAASPANTDYTLKSWTQADGLPGARVWAITQDDDGYIWIGTDAGLVRFDGVTFITWQNLSDSRLPRREVTALCTDRDGSLWIGFGIHGGVARIQDGRVTLYGESEGLSSGFVTFITQDDTGALWVGGLAGLHRFDGSRWERFGAQSGLPEGPSLDAYQDGEENLWIAYTSGVFKRTGSEAFQPDPAPAVHHTTLAQSVFEALTLAPVPALPPFSFLQDQQERVWLATRGQGLWIGRAGNEAAPAKVQHVSARDGLSSDVVQALFEDRDGNVWVGTHAGLHQFSTRRLTPLTDLGVVRALEETSDGSIWAGTYDGVVQLAGASEHRFRQENGGLGSPVTALHGDEHGGLWVATLTSVARVANGRLAPLPLPKSTALSWVSALTTDSRGDLWICDMYQGVFQWSNGELTLFEALPAAVRSTVYSLHTDRAGKVWIGFTNGKIGVIHEDHTFHLYDSITGLDGTVTAIYDDSEGALWIGASDGLSRFEDERFTTATNDRNGIPLDTVTTILEDELGHLWVGTSSGIISLRSDEFDKIEKDPDHQVQYRLYDDSDGLDSMPVRLGTPAGTRRADGKLLFVTGAGAVVVDPSQLTEALAPPTVRIEEVRIDGQRFAPEALLLLPSGHSRLQIAYTALTYAAPTRTRFLYRLEGFDAEWIDADTRREATYTNLPAREYRFQVIARNNQGTWNREGAVLEFYIPPPFYQTGWFYVAGAIVLVVSLWAVWKLRLIHIQRRFSVVLGERARLSRELHDTLLQSLVGVALQFDVLAGSLDGTPESAKRHLRRIRKDVEEHIRETRESIWNLRSRPRMRNLVVALREACERLTRDTTLEVEFDITGNSSPCPTVAEEQLVKIFREAITNVLRHAEARKVRVALRYDNNSILLRVSDDGRGFDADSPLDDMSEHLGLTSMKERAEGVGGELAVSSSPGGGTEVRVVVPIV